MKAIWRGNEKTCALNETISRELFVLGSEFNTTIKQFRISENKEVKDLPKLIGEKLPNLKEFWAKSCGLTIVRSFYFKNMKNLRSLTLKDNQITTIERDSFQDLVSVERMSLNDNLIEILDGKLFRKMVNLDELFLNNNRIKFMRPWTFKISGGKLGFVDLEANICIDSEYDSRNWNQLEIDIRAKCVL